MTKIYLLTCIRNLKHVVDGCLSMGLIMLVLWVICDYCNFPIITDLKDHTDEIINSKNIKLLMIIIMTIIILEITLPSVDFINDLIKELKK